MAKRPTGFGKASKSKKTKTEEPKQPEPEPELTVELATDGEDDELNEIYGLFQKLQAERNPKIARGLIHECDSILKTRDEQNLELPPKFHVVYSGALLTLADPDFEPEEHEAFRKAGLERMDSGLGNSKIDSAVKSLAAQELIRLQHLKKEEELLNRACTLIQHEGEDLETARAAYYLIQLADELQDSELAKTGFEVLNAHLKSKDEDCLRWTNKGLGVYYLNQSAALDEESKEIADLIEKAVPHLEGALSESDPETYVSLAEALLQREDTETALRHLKKAQILGVDDLHELIESLEEEE